MRGDSRAAIVVLILAALGAAAGAGVSARTPALAGAPGSSRGSASAVLARAYNSRASGRQEVPADFVLVGKVQVAGAAAWTDSGLNVQKGQEYYFQAEGSVSLQKDNPIASCGPEGLALRTLQQPLPDQNLGALICKVREKVEVVEDKRSGERTGRDIGEMFFIGKENRIVFPAAGRLLFRVNENVTDDNDGAFEVKIYLKRETKQVSRTEEGIAASPRCRI